MKLYLVVFAICLLLSSCFKKEKELPSVSLGNPIKVTSHRSMSVTLSSDLYSRMEDISRDKEPCCSIRLTLLSVRAEGEPLPSLQVMYGDKRKNIGTISFYPAETAGEPQDFILDLTQVMREEKKIPDRVYIHFKCIRDKDKNGSVVVGGMKIQIVK